MELLEVLSEAHLRQLRHKPATRSAQACGKKIKRWRRALDARLTCKTRLCAYGPEPCRLWTDSSCAARMSAMAARSSSKSFRASRSCSASFAASSSSISLRSRRAATSSLSICMTCRTAAASAIRSSFFALPRSSALLSGSAALCRSPAAIAWPSQSCEVGGR